MVALPLFVRLAVPVCCPHTSFAQPCSTGFSDAAGRCRCRTRAWVAEVIDVKTDKMSDSTDKASGAVNEVRLVGRVSRDPEQRVLPSGDEMWTFRVVVQRPEGGRSRQTVDTLDCAVWGGRVRASVAGWAADDVVEVTGALRKRFYASGGGHASRVEVEVTSGRMVRRAGATRRAASG
jgi:single-strand DNA-binding protein